MMPMITKYLIVYIYTQCLHNRRCLTMSYMLTELLIHAYMHMVSINRYLHVYHQTKKIYHYPPACCIPILLCLQLMHICR